MSLSGAAGLHKMRFTYDGVFVTALPVNVGAEFVPVAVSVCVCPPSAEPVNDGAEFVGTPAGQEIVCVCELPAPDVTLEPVNVCALTVLELPENVGTPAGHAIVGVLIVPAGVPADTAWLSATAALVVFAVPAALTAVAARDV